MTVTYHRYKDKINLPKGSYSSAQLEDGKILATFWFAYNDATSRFVTVSVEVGSDQRCALLEPINKLVKNSYNVEYRLRKAISSRTSKISVGRYLAQNSRIVYLCQKGNWEC